MLAGVPDPSVDESLHAVEQISAMIVVTRRHHQGEIRRGIAGRQHYFGLAVRQRCQPNARSRARNSALGIQRKYHTFLY